MILVEQASSCDGDRRQQPDPSAVGRGVVVSYTVTGGGLTPTGNVTVVDSDGNNCTGTPAARSCVLTPTVAGSKTLTATYGGDINYSGSQATTSHLVVRPALAVSKQAAPDPVQAGAQLTYTLRITNTGDVDLHATVTDTLPAQVTPGGALTWSPVITAPGGVWTQTVVVTVEMGYTGTLTNVVQVSDRRGRDGRLHRDLARPRSRPRWR